MNLERLVKGTKVKTLKKKEPNEGFLYKRIPRELKTLNHIMIK